MKIVDANIILRYLLNDVKDMADKSAAILENDDIYVPNEIKNQYIFAKTFRQFHCMYSN